MAVLQSYRVLESGVTRALLDETLREMGLERRNISEGREPSKHYEEVWSNADATTVINYVEDAFSGQRYVSIRENSDGDVLADFTRRLATYWPGELLEQVYWDLPRAQMVDVLFRIAITFLDFDPDAATALADKALEDKDPNVRAAAVQAIALRAWPEMRPIVQQIAEGAPSGVRDVAAGVLERWPA
jgi:hypothetical protein